MVKMVKNGTNGASDKNGKNGTNGANDTNGKNVTNGANDPNGKIRTIGASNTNGTKGTNATSGANATLNPQLIQSYFSSMCKTCINDRSSRSTASSMNGTNVTSQQPRSIHKNPS